MLTQAALKEWIEYNPELGTFLWLRGQRHGYEAGNIDRYRIIWILGKKYTAAKIAWLYMTGEYPDCIIDHINRICTDDSWSNLRKATPSQNNANRSSYNILGRGVKREGNKFVAEIRVGNRKQYLGIFNTKEEAAQAFKQAAKELHGEFAYEL